MKLTLDPKSIALVTVDMCRGQLDPAVATLPLPPENCARVVARTKELLDQLREMGVPIVHAVQKSRDSAEPAANPFWLAITNDPAKKRGKNLQHNLAYGPGPEVMPELLGPGDFLVDTKKRYSSFYATDLEFLLRSRLGAKTIILAGVNTNTCVQCTAFDATNRDFAVVVASDCVDTMDGEEMHRFALRNIGNALGWVLNNEEIVQTLKAAIA